MVISPAPERPRGRRAWRPGAGAVVFDDDRMRKSGFRIVLWAWVLVGAGLRVDAAPAPQGPASWLNAVQWPAATKAEARPATAGPGALSQGAPPQPAGGPQATPPQKPAAEGHIIWCGQELGPPSPAQLPPAGSGPVVFQIGICFPEQGGVSTIEAETYLYSIHTKTSNPRANLWSPWDDTATPEALRQDFKQLWATTFIDNLSIEVTDYPFSNGVIGKLIAYNIEERQRVKIVDYQGAKHLERSKIDDKLKEENATIRLDSFIDPGMVRKVKKVVLDMLAEKGFQFATVTPDIKPLPGGPKLVNVTFMIDEGPQVKIRDVVFVGSKAISSSALKRQMKNNKGRGTFSFLTGSSSYQEGKYEEDAEKVVGYYRDHGYYTARVGDPSFRYLEDSGDRKTRWVELRIEVTEGERYRVGSLTFDGNKIIRSEGLRALFKVKDGDWYSDKAIRKGYEKARELYGSAGYYQFNLVPMAKPHEEGGPAAAGAAAPEAKAAQPDQPPAGEKAEAPAPARQAEAPQTPAMNTPGKQAPAKTAAAKPRDRARRLDVTLQVDEGKQYFINRIQFTGNTTTRDTVVRRELRLFEEGVFNTEALKYSIKRINQLAYFKQLEGGKEVDVKETPGTDNKMDITVKVEEQNRNQLQFGAGVSQYEGFFGTLGFQTSNFMGRGETFSVNLQAGSRAQNYMVAFTEPYLFDRPITGGVDLFKRRLEYVGQFTQDSVGGNIIFGFPLKDFTRMFLNYSYEHTKVVDLNPAYLNPALIASNPYLAASLLLGAGGARTISKIVPSISYNTVDNPISPNTGQRYTVSVDLAGLGGDTSFWKPFLEGVRYFQHTKRTSLGLRAQFSYIATFTGSKDLLITEKLFAGGEYSVRGFDIRTIGPRAMQVVPPTYAGTSFLPALMPGDVSLETRTVDSGLVVGGNKMLLLNAEYLISVVGPVRLVLFYDAGQVRGEGEKMKMSEFKASTGAEVRFFMPVLNVPFRLIFAYNPFRAGVLNNNLQPQGAFAFKFAVGSTF
jgi:outer membrane protein insertion porin family